MSSRTITIVCHGPNRFDVFEGERFADRLTWDEMLGQVAHLTHHKIGEARYDSLTPEEHQQRRERWLGSKSSAVAIPAAAASTHE